MDECEGNENKDAIENKLIYYASENHNPQLNEQQLDMLRLLKKPMPNEYFMQIKRLAVQLLGEQLDDTIEKWEEENNITEADYENLSKEHYRTPYKKS